MILVAVAACTAGALTIVYQLYRQRQQKRVVEKRRLRRAVREREWLATLKQSRNE